MNNLTELLNELLSILKSLKEHNIITAVAYLLGGGTTSCNASSIFLFILNSYVSFIANNRNLAEKYDGYMIKTVRDIHNYTLYSEKSIRTALKILEGANLIEYKAGGVNNATRIRITDKAPDMIRNNFISFIEVRDEDTSEIKDSRDKQKLLRQNRVEIRKVSASKEESKKEEKQREREAKKKEQEKKNGFIPFNRDYKDAELTVNEAMYDTEKINNVFSVVKDSDERKASCCLVYLFSYYYRLYTGNDYNWDYLKYDILMKAVKDYYKYPNIEICISIALRKALNTVRSGLGNKRKLEDTFAEKFNHDYNYHHLNNLTADTDGYQGYKFDNILNLEEYYPSYYYERSYEKQSYDERSYDEHRPSLVIKMNDSNLQRFAMFYN